MPDNAGLLFVVCGPSGVGKTSLVRELVARDVPPGVLAYDARAALDTYYTLVQNLSSDDLKKDFTVSEKINTGYLKLDIDTSLTDAISMRGNIGAQLVHSDQSSTGFNIDSASGGVVGDLKRGDKYTDVLPSLNLVIDYGDGWLSRLGADPALASGPVATVLQDILSVAIYLGIATAMLHG